MLNIKFMTDGCPEASLGNGENKFSVAEAFAILCSTLSMLHPKSNRAKLHFAGSFDSCPESTLKNLFIARLETVGRYIAHDTTGCEGLIC